MRRNQLQFIAGAMVLLFGVIGLSAQTSSWASLGSDGRLHYATDANGNRIMDFSSAGYKGGGVALPAGVPVRATVGPSGGDDRAAIQAAIDAVSALPLDANGFRGAIQLTAGSFSVSTPPTCPSNSSSLTISASGVVLRGAGSGADGTIINMTGDPCLFLRINGTGSAQTTSSKLITDSYV